MAGSSGRFGKWNTARRWFRGWAGKGVFSRVSRALRGETAYMRVMSDGTNVVSAGSPRARERTRYRANVRFRVGLNTKSVAPSTRPASWSNPRRSPAKRVEGGRCAGRSRPVRSVHRGNGADADRRRTIPAGWTPGCGDTAGIQPHGVEGPRCRMCEIRHRIGNLFANIQEKMESRRDSTRPAPPQGAPGSPRSRGTARNECQQAPKSIARAGRKSAPGIGAGRGRLRRKSITRKASGEFLWLDGAPRIRIFARQ